MERLFRTSIDILLPMYSSTFLLNMENLQKEQSPPYSDGIYYIQLLQRLKTTSLIGNVTQVIFNPLLAALFKEDLFFANSDITKFSLQKLKDSYFIYSEDIQSQYIGYELNHNSFVSNKNDDTLDLASLRQMFLSKDLTNFKE